ncbi:nucleoid occlusion protein [Roseovarius sp. A-2]|uniref:ParB/RepB/Spo0J family partition protein n=1 Tax=Roseovarius sp. A-2 TaxID=1570360 RepID=UPI0009B5798F|nr:ParB N-terminal domain-containing protein [Roseovarius sp. A-2]GAW37132.1 nucleoid occlusion protein [Roseovarius sp. A-2]
MAKRRKLETPSADDLLRIEEEFRRETSSRPGLTPGATVAPIAQVAGEAAAQAEVSSPEIRAGHAHNAAEAKRLQEARADGRLMSDLPLSEIDPHAMIRDRIDLSEDEMSELRQSIAASGLRLPIEVFEFATPRADGVRYGLVSGYRRYMAVLALRDLTEAAKYASIRAIVRPRTEADQAFVSMVEENEVRSELSHFERGRIAVIAAQQGAFVNVEDAVNRLYATASKAKRSKVRSFAMIFEELGDMLTFPEALTEKRGLSLAQGLRAGAEGRLRAALEQHPPADAEAEWAQIDAVLSTLDAPARDKRRGGRPRASAPISGWQGAETLHTSAGITIRRMQDDKGILLRFEGRGLDSELMDSLMQEIRALLEKP